MKNNSFSILALPLIVQLLFVFTSVKVKTQNFDDNFYRNKWNERRTEEANPSMKYIHPYFTNNLW